MFKKGIRKRKFNVACYCCETIVECEGPEWYDDIQARMLPQSQYKKDNWGWTMTEGGVAAFCGQCEKIAYKDGLLKDVFRKKMKKEFCAE